MRSVNDYSLSSHELFTRNSCKDFPYSTRVYTFKFIPSLEEFDLIKNEIFSNFKMQYPTHNSNNYNVKYRDSLKEDMDSYTIYGQDFLILTNYDSSYNNIINSTVVVESYRRSEELIVIVLSDENLDWMDEMYTNIQNRYEEQVPDNKNTFFTIVRTANGGFDLQSMELTTVYDEEVITRNYNDSFRETWNLTLEAIDNDKNGLILLHGVPGSGKTHVLKQIIARGGKRKIVYIPSYLATSLSDPSFIGFVRKQMSSAVLVIEDGEDVLISRELSNGNAAVTNILQISDGIMGDALNMLIISTFNTDLSKIDEALQRKGRMIAEYKFEALEPNKAQTLIDHLYGEDNDLVFPNDETYTLANIFQLETIQPKTRVAPKRSIGFK